MKELIKEFIKTYCPKCNGYAFCGGEIVGCVQFKKFLKEKEVEKRL